MQYSLVHYCTRDEVTNLRDIDHLLAAGIQSASNYNIIRSEAVALAPSMHISCGSPALFLLLKVEVILYSSSNSNLSFFATQELIEAGVLEIQMQHTNLANNSFTGNLTLCGRIRVFWPCTHTHCTNQTIYSGCEVAMLILFSSETHDSDQLFGLGNAFIISVHL